MTTTHRPPPGYPPHSRPVPADPAIDAMVAALPKVSLHCHLIGTVAPATVVAGAGVAARLAGVEGIEVVDRADFLATTEPAKVTPARWQEVLTANA